MEVNTRKLLQYPGVVDNEGTLQMLIISSSQQYLENLQKSIYSTRDTQKDKRTYNLRVHISKSLSDVFVHFSPEDFKIDYVIFVVNIHNSDYFDELEADLKSLQPFFGKEKICLVNPDPTRQTNYFQPQELWEFVKYHQLNLINGKILDEECVKNVSKRILNLAESCCGITNGIPLVGYV